MGRLDLSALVPGANHTLADRIAKRVVRDPENPDACWAWSGKLARKRDGVKRPQIQVGGFRSGFQNAARVILALHDGVSLTERQGLHAGHTCGHYWCVNPAHLVWQTQSQNEKEKARRFQQALREELRGGEA